MLEENARPLIRIVGDSVLHQPGIPFPKHPNSHELLELNKQIDVAKDTLIRTGGAGIAANQCAQIDTPYCFAIVGVFYEIPTHIEAVTGRYPNSNFPQAQIIVNPRVINSSEKMQSFNHACLSIPCANRCEVKSPQQLVVQFQDPLRDMLLVTKEYEDLDAVVLWHELNHILEGNTYLDTVFASLTQKELLLFKSLLKNELDNRRDVGACSCESLSGPPFYFTVKLNEQMKSQLVEQQLEKLLPQVNDELLRGLLERLKKY